MEARASPPLSPGTRAREPRAPGTAHAGAGPAQPTDRRGNQGTGRRTERAPGPPAGEGAGVQPDRLLGGQVFMPPSRCAQTATGARTGHAPLALHVHLGWPGPSQRPWYSWPSPRAALPILQTPPPAPPLPKEPADPRSPRHSPPAPPEPAAPPAPAAQAARVCRRHRSSGCWRIPSRFLGSCLRGNRRKESEGPPHFTGEPQACPSIFWLPANAHRPEPQAWMGIGRGTPVLWLQPLAPTRP